MLEFGVLGPLQVLRDGTRLELGGPRQRAVLARLLIDAGRVVPVDVLVDDVWAGRPPESAAKTLQKYVSQLRKVLGPSVLATSGGGYRADIPDDALDSLRFQRLSAAGDHEAALALWRGDVLSDLPDTPFADPERARLDEQRLTVLERSLEAELDAGRHGEAVASLRELTQKYPMRERLCALHMLGLYRSGRQVEALQAFHRHRQRLVEELGVEPANELVELERAILRHDADLEIPTRRTTAEQESGNLQLPVSSFIGRHVDVQAVATALREHRLVTLVGPGGVGKTRLALHVGARLAPAYPGGAWLVDLSSLTDPDLVAHRLATTLRIPEQPGQNAEETVLAALEHRPELLLVFDSCEHLIARSAALADAIVRSTPQVRILATSRRPLGADGERVVPVAPLADPDACRLFADRARQAGASDHDTVEAQAAGICRSLDGLPLALELAAGQLRVLGPAEVAARLDERLQFASDRFDVPPRQQSLRDMVAWSHELLPATTQRVFARLGVFATTLTLDAAAAVGEERDTLRHVTTLVQHSLLSRDPGSTAPPRFRLLDTLRLFALDKLAEAGEEEQARRAHAGYYLRLAREASPHLVGPHEQDWADRVEAEEPNLHAALAWSAEHDPELALSLGVALWRYWDMRWREGHAVAYFTTVLDTHRAVDVPDVLRAWARAAMADLVANPGEARQAARWATEALHLFRAAGDEAGITAALLALGSAHRNAGDLDAADRDLEEAARIARRTGDAVRVASALNLQSSTASRRGDHRRAEVLSRQELAAWQAIGSRRGELTAMRHVAVNLLYLGELDEASRLCRLALAAWQGIGNAAAVAHVQLTLGDISRSRGDLDRALTLYDDAFVELRRVGDRRCSASTFRNLAEIAGRRGDPTRSTELYLEAIRLRHELGDHAGLAECFEGIAANLAVLGQHSDAAVVLAAAARRRRQSGSLASPVEAVGTAAVEARIEAAIPPPRRAQARVTGERLTVDEAVEFVLSLELAPADAPHPVG